MRKLRILIIEDEPALAALLKQVLLQKGHDVHVFSDPTSCPVYRGHESECPQNTACADVIISDHMMPNMTGIDFFRFQRMRGCKAPDENKVLITGTAIHADLKKAIEESEGKEGCAGSGAEGFAHRRSQGSKMASDIDPDPITR